MITTLAAEEKTLTCQMSAFWLIILYRFEYYPISSYLSGVYSTTTQGSLLERLFDKLVASMPQFGYLIDIFMFWGCYLSLPFLIPIIALGARGIRKRHPLKASDTLQVFARTTVLFALSLIAYQTDIALKWLWFDRPFRLVL